MRYSIYILATGVLVFAAASASARDDGLRLENVQGGVSVQMPVGFLAAEDGLAVHVGQQISLRANSSVIISSAENSCFVNLRKPGIYLVPSLDKCSPGQVMVPDGTFQPPPVNGDTLAGAAYGGTESFVAAGAFVAATFGSALLYSVLQDPVTTP